MDSQLTHEQYTLVPSEPTSFERSSRLSLVTKSQGGRNPYRKTTTSSSWSKEPQFLKKCKQYSKYGLVFSGIAVIILMVVYGINNISLQTFSAQNSTVLDDYNMTDSNNTTTITMVTLPTLWPEAPLGTSTTQTTTTFHPRDIFNMLNPSDHGPEEEQEPKEDVPTTEQEPKDVVISNKTVIIDGGNDSIIINDNF